MAVAGDRGAVAARRHRARQVRARIVQLAQEYREACRQQQEAYQALCQIGLSETAERELFMDAEQRAYDAMVRRREALFFAVGLLEMLEREAVSTRGVIARPRIDGGWAGVYCHWDNYPQGRGKALWDVCHDEAHGDVEDMLRYFIDEHPGGWSTAKCLEYEPDNPLYDPTRFWSKGRYPGACYCHRADTGERGPEPDMPVTSDGDHCGAQYAYVLDAASKTMTIQAWDYEGRCWSTTGVVDLDGLEPDWGTFSAR